MKTQFKLAALTLLSSFIHHPSSLRAQGGLTPPGAPAPTMKTLEQIEPRTPISSAPYTIREPGSYYLTTHVAVSTNNAITIATNDVTLDLCGWTISSTSPSASGAGIWLTASLRNITILNGYIQSGVTNNGSGIYDGPGFLYGIYYPRTFNGRSFVGYPGNARVTGVSVSGCLDDGINLGYGDSVVVESCTVRTAGNAGITGSLVKNSAAWDCGNTGIFGDTVVDCEGQAAGGYGIFGTAITQNCYGSATTGYGIDAYNAVNCYGASSNSYGVVAYVAQACTGYSVNNVGLYAYNLATSCYGQSSGTMALYAYNAAFCSGNVNQGTAIQAVIATGCIATIGGTNNVTYKYNMP